MKKEGRKDSEEFPFVPLMECIYQFSPGYLQGMNDNNVYTRDKNELKSQFTLGANKSKDLN